MKLGAPVVLTLLIGAHVHAAELPAAQEPGRGLFARHCAACHGERGHATTLLEKRLGKDQAPLEQRDNLTVALIRHVVRHGINSMPWFTRVELPDADVTAISAYLTRTTR